jgi:F0F1-type ATP synthase epsilon subunit
MPTFTLKIVSPDLTVYQGQVDEVVMTTRSGQQAILSNHWDSIMELEVGFVSIFVSGQNEPTRIAVNGGTATFQSNILNISTIEAEEIKGRKADLKLFPNSILEKDTEVKAAIQKALEQGGVYDADKNAISSLLSEERMAKVQLLQEMLKGY